MTPPRKPEAVVRPARPGDVEMIVKMIHELAVYERAPDQCHATVEKMTEQLFGKKPHVEGLVAEVEGKLAGYALFFHNFSTWESAPGIYLEDVYVRPTYRRMGIGRQFVVRLAALAVERGCPRFDWAVLDWNKPARDFYRELGAREMNEWVAYRLEGEALRVLAGQEPAKHPGLSKKRTRPLTYFDDSTDESPVPAEVTPGAKAPRVVVHTDGGADPNPGIGAWAAVLRFGDAVREISGGTLATTNNRMELTAAIKALESLKTSCNVVMFTDSQYVKKGITEWIKKWKKAGWKKSSGAREPVLNADLWKRLDELASQHFVEWQWLRGHAGNEDNERCDALCSEVIARLKHESTPEDRKKAMAEEKNRAASQTTRPSAGFLNDEE